jgi:hypothetical protein
MSTKRMYEGESINGSFQEALSDALQRLAEEIAESGVCDAYASWDISHISGEYGGIAGLRKVKVKISAARSPAWNDR